METEKENTDLNAYFKRIQEDGVSFFAKEKPISRKKACKYLMREDTSYMVDYVFAENGKIREVHLDEIEKK